MYNMVLRTKMKGMGLGGLLHFGNESRIKCSTKKPNLEQVICKGLSLKVGPFVPLKTIYRVELFLL